MEPLRDKIFEDQWRWFGYISRITEDRLTKRIYAPKVKVKYRRSRPSSLSIPGIREDAEKWGIRWNNIKCMVQWGRCGDLEGDGERKMHE